MEQVISNRQYLIRKWTLHPVGELDEFVNERLMLYVINLN